MLRFGKTKVAKEECYCAKMPIKIWAVDVNNITISKLFETKNNSKCLIGCLDKVTRLLVLIMPKINGYVETFKDNGEDKSKNNKLMSLHIDDDKLSKKYKTI